MNARHLVPPVLAIGLLATSAAAQAPSLAKKPATQPPDLARPLPAGSFLGGSDDCATALPIAGQGVFAFDNSAATTGTEGQNEGACYAFGSSAVENDVWFIWTADATGVALLQTCGGTTVDTKIAAYPGAGCPVPGTVLDCNDDTCALQSSIAWSATIGSAYTFQLGTFPGAPGGVGTFEVSVLTGGALATYDAGTAGSPPVAPDPQTQGWTLVDPSGGQVVLSDVSPDGTTGLNAWSVDDDVTFTGGRAHYAALFDVGEILAAKIEGWELTTDMRMIDSNGVDMFYEFATGQSAADDRYLVFFEVSGNDVLAQVFLTGQTYVCTGAMDGAHHEFTIRKPAGLGVIDAEFLYDGVVLGVLPRASSNGNAPGGGVHWGSGSSLATGNAYFNAVEFRIGPGGLTLDYCFGDGSGTPCPCGNTGGPGEGCANSSGAGALLEGAGSASVSADDITFHATNLLAFQPALLFAGQTAINGGNGIPFGDGLRCAGQNVVRLGIMTPDANGEADWGPGLGAIGGWGPGDSRYFQAWYRDPIGSPCGFLFNLSQGIGSVTFVP